MINWTQIELQSFGICEGVYKMGEVTYKYILGPKTEIYDNHSRAHGYSDDAAKSLTASGDSCDKIKQKSIMRECQNLIGAPMTFMQEGKVVGTAQIVGIDLAANLFCICLITSTKFNPSSVLYPRKIWRID